MDLLILIGILYLVGTVITPILIRTVSGLNEYLHEMINSPNPAVFSTVIWPILFIAMFIYHTYKLFTAIINWASGNGFITESNKDYKKLSDYKYL